jgi:hypothetical protein
MPKLTPAQNIGCGHEPNAVAATSDDQIFFPIDGRAAMQHGFPAPKGQDSYLEQVLIGRKHLIARRQSYRRQASSGRTSPLASAPFGKVLDDLSTYFQSTGRALPLRSLRITRRANFNIIQTPQHWLRERSV